MEDESIGPEDQIQKIREDKDMKEEGIIRAERRSHAGGGANNRLRKDGYLLGSVNEKGNDSYPISVRKDEFVKDLAKYGRNSVFKLEIPGEKPISVVIKEIENEPDKGGYLHIDFQKIILSAETKTNVSIRVTGKETIDTNRWILMHQMEAIPVKGLPRNIPDSIEIDVASLKPGDNITIGNLTFPKGILCELDPAQVVLNVKSSWVQDVEEESKESKEA